MSDPDPWNSKGPYILPNTTCSLHCSSFLALPFRILNIDLVKPKKKNYNGDYRYLYGTRSQKTIPIMVLGP